MDAELRQVIVPADDLDAVARFYGDVVGLPLRFRDGDRWAAFDAGAVTLAVAAAAEHPPGAPVAAAFKVPDVGAAVAQLAAAGASVLQEPVEGEHEVRAAVTDPAGNVVVLYASRPRPRPA